jgi:glyoxylase-like metal-dependent hydrolase (beta-lactamase superfamily II)
MAAACATGSEIHAIPIDTPWAVGSVNVYLLDRDPLTLVDAGQRSPEALAQLEAGLRAAGRRVEDLERIVLTHQHIDHTGLAATLIERSGAELCALDLVAEWMASFPASLDAEDDFAEDLLRRHGVGPKAAVVGAHRGGQGFGDAAVVSHVLADGDVLAFSDRELRVLHRPGHSPFDTVFHDEERGILFGGDHVLRWPSTPIMSPPLGDGDRNGRPRAFAAYQASLRATALLEVETLLPGHGHPVTRHRETIASRLRRYERITDETAATLSREPRTAAEIAAELKGAVPDTTAFFVLCEVLGHLDELIDAGRAIEQVDADGVSRFAAVGDG